MQARDWLKRGFKVSNKSLLEGDHFYLENIDSDEQIMMFNGPGWDEPEESRFDFDDLSIDTWFILKEESLSEKIINDEPHEAVYVEDLKETIKNLKDDINIKLGEDKNDSDFEEKWGDCTTDFFELINKHFGKELI